MAREDVREVKTDILVIGSEAAGAKARLYSIC